MKNWVKAVIAAGSAAVGGLVTLAVLGKDENTDVVDADFEEVADDFPSEDEPTEEKAED